MLWRPTLDSPDHERGEKNDTGGGSDLGDKLSEVVELELKGSILGVSLKS